MTALNPSQVAILNLFSIHQSEEDLKKLKKVLVDYLFQRTIEEANKVWDERAYSDETVEQWRHENMRVNVEEVKKRKMS
jgi:hypothetical protein